MDDDRWSFFTWFDSVSAREDLRSVERHVAIAIGRHGNGYGECWPSRSRIMAMTGYRARAVSKAIVRLECEGILDIRRERGKTSWYVCVDPDEWVRA